MSTFPASPVSPAAGAAAMGCLPTKSKAIKREPRFVRVQVWTVQEVLIPHYRQEVRRHIENALWWKKHPQQMSGTQSAMQVYQRYLGYAKYAAEEGKYFAKKVGIHFGRLPKKAQVAS